MTRAVAYQIRSMIHETEKSAPLSNRERDLVAVASVKIWEGDLRKLWTALRRAAEINFSRWAPVMMTVEKFFHNPA